MALSALQEERWGRGGRAGSSRGHLHKVHLSPLRFHPIILRTRDEMGSPFLLLTLTAPIPRGKASLQTTNRSRSRRETNKDKANLKIFMSRLFPLNWQVPLSEVNTSQPSDY